MVVDLPRRWRWVVAAGCAAVVVLAALFVVFTRSAEQEAAAAARAVPSVLHAPAVDTVPAMEALPAPETAMVPRGVDEIEVCGVGWVPAKPDGSYDEAAFERLTKLVPSRGRILAAMRADGGEMAQASALVLEMSTDGAAAREALIRVALSTTDPAVYRLAFRQCVGKNAGEGACQMLSAERWAQLDPENASPWFYILEAARSRNDEPAQQEALHRIASASRSQSGFLEAAGAMLNAAPDDDEAQVAALALVSEAIGIEAAGMQSYQGVTTACRGDALKDSNQAQTCAAIADVLADRSDSLMASIIGAAIGRRVGWPADRSDLIRGEINAYQARPAVTARSDQNMTCGAVREWLGVVRQKAAIGETGAMREWIAQSGKQPEDFVREERERQARTVQRLAAGVEK